MKGEGCCMGGNETAVAPDEEASPVTLRRTFKAKLPICRTTSTESVGH